MFIHQHSKHVYSSTKLAQQVSDRHKSFARVHGGALIAVYLCFTAIFCRLKGRSFILTPASQYWLREWLQLCRAVSCTFYAWTNIADFKLLILFPTLIRSFNCDIAMVTVCFKLSVLLSLFIPLIHSMYLNEYPWTISLSLSLSLSLQHALTFLAVDWTRLLPFGILTFGSLTLPYFLSSFDSQWMRIDFKQLLFLPAGLVPFVSWAHFLLIVFGVFLALCLFIWLFWVLSLSGWQVETSNQWVFILCARGFHRNR